MKKVLLGIVVAVAAGTGTIGAIAYNGLIDIGADTPHDPLVFDTIEWVRERAIARRLADISTPQDLGSEERVISGAGNYEAMCASCHLKPGMPDSEIRRGLYPQPPSLAIKAADDKAAPPRRFWIIKHGIKASGMPAWGKGGMTDGDIWNLVAFLDRLPGMTQEQYRTLQAAGTGHTHGGEAVHEAESDHEQVQVQAQEKTQQKADKHTHDKDHSH